MFRRASSFALLSCWLCWVERAPACGLTPPIGPTGLPSVCHGDEHAPRIRLGANVGFTATTLNFGARTADLLQTASSATLDVSLFQRLTLSATLGSALGGHLDYGGQRYQLTPGVIGGVSVSYLLFGGKVPFVHGSFSYSLAHVRSEAPGVPSASFDERDYRLGLAVGQVIGFAAPFVVARYFGAGTEWSVGGGHGADHYRYHVGVGSAFAFSPHFDGLLEIAFLGERRGSVGVGYTF